MDDQKVFLEVGNFSVTKYVRTESKIGLVRTKCGYRYGLDPTSTVKQIKKTWMRYPYAAKRVCVKITERVYTERVYMERVYTEGATENVTAKVIRQQG